MSQAFNIKEAQRAIISAKALNTQNMDNANRSLAALKAITDKLSPEKISELQEKGIDLNYILTVDWDRLVSDKEYKDKFIADHENILTTFLNHIRAGLGQL